MKIAFHTLGCKVNQYETEAMRLITERVGYETVELGSDVDVLVINSCTVTAESDRKLRQTLRRFRRQYPSAVLVLTGCMPQAFPQTAASFDEADIVLGNAARRDLVRHIEAFLTHRQRIVDIPPHDKLIEDLSIESFAEHTRAFVKIQDGCNRFCSYCIIPYARGRVRSKNPEELRRELQALAINGYQEIVLVGINLSAYGQDNGKSLADAVEVACNIDGVERVRLGSLEPDFLTDEMLARLVKQPKLCPQFHVALQSGCDTTLKRMNRHYTTEEFAALCDKLRHLFPDCALTTDVMVGFPGESDEDFEQSLAFVQKIGFSRVHVFAYSRRSGTVADKLPQQIPSDVKTARSRRMIEASQRLADDYARTYIGRTVPVLLETAHSDGFVDGLTDTYLTVKVRTDKNSGEFITARITCADGDTLIGEEV